MNLITIKLNVNVYEVIMVAIATVPVLALGATTRVASPKGMAADEDDQRRG